MSAVLKMRPRNPAPPPEAPGRRIGAVIGSWVTDLAELKQTIILCWKCQEEFRKVAPRYHYHFAENWNKIWGGVHGKCDACREPGVRRSCFVHQSYLGKSYNPESG